MEAYASLVFVVGVMQESAGDPTLQAGLRCEWLPRESQRPMAAGSPSRD